MMKSKIFIKSINPNQVLRVLSSLKITIYKVSYVKDGIYIIVLNKDLDYIQKLYPFNLIKRIGLSNIGIILSQKWFQILFLIFGFFLYYYISNIIVLVSIEHSNVELNKLILTELESYGIKRLSYAKDFQDLQEIKDNILKKYPDKIEWIEIYRQGMIYVIRLEERIINYQDISLNRCNVVAKKEGIIRSAHSSKGVIVVEKNQYVKENDILISGEITFNEETKGIVCASGVVKAESWYTVNITMPLTEKRNNYNGKKRYNFYLKRKNKKIKIFKDRLENAITKEKKLFNILGFEFILESQYEYEINEVKLEENEATDLAKQKAIEKLLDKIGKESSIISQKVLKKSLNDSTIELDIFMVVEENIGVQKEIIEENNEEVEE